MAKLADDKKKEEARKAAILSGELVETGASSGSNVATCSGSGRAAAGYSAGDVDGGTVPANKEKYVKDRMNASTVWNYYGKWVWDNTTTPARKVAPCTLCDRKISASSTTNLKAHLTAKHSKKLIEDLQMAAADDHGNDDLGDLMKDAAPLNTKQGKVDKFTGAKKRNLDEVLYTLQPT